MRGPTDASAAERAHDTRVAAILRLLRDRAEQVPELEGSLPPAGRFAEQPETRGFAREILARLGIEVPVEPTERGVFVDERTGISFVAIPAGEFQMGSERGDSNGEAGSPRPHHARIPAREVSRDECPIRAFPAQAAGKSVQKPAYWDDRRFNQPEQPVVGVSWDEARAYCEWAGGRLPTEAEWEYACRAGTTTEYSFGDDAELLEEYAWFDKNSGGQTQPVGAKKPNPWGLHDMHGNVWEWCQDWFDGDVLRTTSPTDDPPGPERGSSRVFRGGGWGDGASCCRASYRRGAARRPHRRPGLPPREVSFLVTVAECAPSPR